MSQQFARSQPLHMRFGDVFVILSVTLLSLAVGAGLIARLGLELSSALLVSLAIYCSLLAFHLVMRRSFTERDADEEEEAYDPDAHWQTDGDRFESELGHADRAGRAALHDDMGDPAHHSRPGQWPEPLPMPRDHAPAPGASADPSAGHDPFTFRPSRSPYFEDDAAPEAGQPPSASAPTDAGTPQPEMNVELIQDLIKKLADELNGGPPATADLPAEPSLAPQSDTEAMIGRSVAALDAAARTMRGGAEMAPGLGVPPAQTSQRAARPRTPLNLDPKVARIAEALGAERIEVLLQPINTLSEGRPRHYEVSMRLRMSDGMAMEQAEFSRMAHGSGLMPRIDAARMLRAARVARRLGDRGRQGSVLTALTGESLVDGEFLDAAALQTGNDGRVSLVLAFAQNDVRTFTPVHAEALGSMAASGFGFALEDVTDLDMDFGALKAMGFEFVKLDAPVFLEGLPTSGGRIPATDICRYLSEYGLTVIVGRIEDEWLLQRVLSFGVQLGNGAFFGPPKLVKPEIVSERGSAAA